MAHDRPLLSNIDEITAQAELDDKMLTHYVLGRCLAMEKVLRAVIDDLPESRRKKLRERFGWETDVEMRMAVDEGFESPEEAQRYVMRAGLIHALIVIGF
jgi:hypothetical protein